MYIMAKLNVNILMDDETKQTKIVNALINSQTILFPYFTSDKVGVKRSLKYLD